MTAPRDKRLVVRLSGLEKGMHEITAARSGMGISELTRLLLDWAGENPDEVDRLKRLRRQVVTFK